MTIYLLITYYMPGSESVLCMCYRHLIPAMSIGGAYHYPLHFTNEEIRPREGR